MNELFDQPYDTTEENWVVKGYFDRMYSDGDFVRAIKLLVERNVLNTDGAYCDFIDNIDDGSVGGEFAWGHPPSEDETVIVSEETCFEYLKLAAKKYIQRHPEDACVVQSIVSKLE
ncbi:ribonuclease toxin immunity protein CdiI [Klebsiella spallanzanii]